MVVPPVITPGSKGKPDAQSHSAPLSPNRSSEPSTSSRTQKPSKTLKNESRVSRMRHTTTHDRRILMMALAAGFPAVLVALILLWDGAYPARLQWTLTVVIVGVLCAEWLLRRKIGMR